MTKEQAISYLIGKTSPLAIARRVPGRYPKTGIDFFELEVKRKLLQKSRRYLTLLAMESLNDSDFKTFLVLFKTGIIRKFIVKKYLKYDSTQKRGRYYGLATE